MNTEWKPIASAPENEGRPLFCELCWGPEGDQATGSGFRLNGKWYAAGVFYCLGQEKRYELREVEVQPTHWKPRSDLPDEESAAPTSHPIPTGATGEDGRSATYGMTLGERIAHVGGRTNAQGYTEFGSPMAVNALIQHVLRDLYWTRQDDDGAYQARYRLPGGEWSSWGHVVCGVKGHEQELRYLPGERRPAPAAGDALDERQDWMACDMRHRMVTDNLKLSAVEMRAREKRCRNAYTLEYMGAPMRWLADVYAEASAVFEAKLAALAAIAQQSQRKEA